MASNRPKLVAYKRARFVTQLPADCLYSAAHVWLADRGQGVWRVGLTKFATRMLGEMVDHGVDVERETAVHLGQVIGWIEGFKAISDLFCVVAGQFAGSNPALADRIELVSRDPYGAGWVYQVRGKPDPACMDVHAYARFLDKTIDRILEKQKAAEPTDSGLSAA